MCMTCIQEAESVIQQGVIGVTVWFLYLIHHGGSEISDVTITIKSQLFPLKLGGSIEVVRGTMLW